MAARRRATAELRVGMTHNEAAAAVAAAWPGLTLDLYRMTPDYYHNSTNAADAGVPGDEVLGDADSPRQSLQLTGATTFKELRDFVIAAFHLAPVLQYREYIRNAGRGTHDTIADLHADAERHRAAFVAAHGREPTRADRWEGESGWLG